ncbi:ankyrin [Dendrothele bispora CBS 962.96]|uniref:Ankyrin n=1 Tax=Dendrothele bispora (strain CBS 962.96) TaxID=1314807 RepID=A0A4S8LVX0_DENBC|nr:ankyrin [Dendrothele bispora CBS 962.96]
MPQTQEAQTFLDRIMALPQGPRVSLREALQPSLEDEAALRRMWAQDKLNARLANLYVGLVDVFDAPADIRTIRARVIQPEKDGVCDVQGTDDDPKYVMPLTPAVRKKEGEPCMVNDLEEFKKNWSVFSEGSLSQLTDWNNVVAAGGSVLACLTPLPEESKVSKRAIRKYYHGSAYPTSDVDLFLWGLTPDEAEKKIITIYEAVRDSVPWDVTCVRTKHTVSIHSQYPYRSVQIVLRLYSSPAEILAGFDIDAPCCAYDGTRVWANPRAIVAMMRQCNTVDMTRRSPSYEVRLTKYSSRGFEVYVPSLERDKVDPTIYERSIGRINGLARLLVFEKLKDGDSRSKFLEARRTLRGRPNALSTHYRRKKKYKGDLKGNMDIGGLEMNDYDVISLHIPYGPGWDARRIEKLVYQTDLGMNSTFNPKNKGRRLHRHSAFFGTVEECMTDCCEFCPAPIDADERKLQKEEDEKYIRGHISFVQEDPGRQSMSGSFNPIDNDEWSEQVYIGNTTRFFAEIIAGDRNGVKEMIRANLEARAAKAANLNSQSDTKSKNKDAPAEIVNKRDHVGRMPLHVAVLAKQTEIAYDLIDAGARISSRLADGRTALHCAAQMGLKEVITKLLEMSKANEKKEKEKEKETRDGEEVIMTDVKERPSSEDDWTSDDNGVVSLDEDEEMKNADEDEDGNVEGGDEGKDEDENENEDGGSKARKTTPGPPETPAPESGALPEDKEDEPDILDINAPEWDLGFTPLAFAIMFSSLSVVDVLIAAGAECNALTSASNSSNLISPLTVTKYRADGDGNEDNAVEIAKKLVQAGAISSAADRQMQTILHTLIAGEKPKLVETLLKMDPKATAVINLPHIPDHRHNLSPYIFPIVSALTRANYSMVAILLAYGAKLKFDSEDVARAIDILKSTNRRYVYQDGDPLKKALTPAEATIASHTELVQLVVSLGAVINTGTESSLESYVNSSTRRSILDWVQFGIAVLNKQIDEKKAKDSKKGKNRGQSEQENANLSGWKAFAAKILRLLLRDNNASIEEWPWREEQRRKEEQDHRKRLCLKSFFSDVERLLVSKGAKTYNEVYPDSKQKSTASLLNINSRGHSYKYGYLESSPKPPYRLLSTNHAKEAVHMHLNTKYDELFEAAFSGDNETVQRLCLPSAGTTSDASPLQITVEVGHPDNERSTRSTGLTPLVAALEGRQWNTARLIFSISIAQYAPVKEENKFKIKAINFDDDDDDNDNKSVDSDESGDTVGAKPRINLVDVSNRPSAVKCSVPPTLMLENCPMVWVDKNETRYSHRDTPLERVIQLGDMEAFINIANIYKLADPPIKLDDNVLSRILRCDEVEMLDEFIRRTGKGVSIKEQSEGGTKEGATSHTTTDSTRLYLGLNVHGKKRKDLAAKNDPNADTYVGRPIRPLLWKAIEGAKIVDYLGTSRPYEAYKYYAMCNSDYLAISLRRRSDLEKVLPVWLGWTMIPTGESPLSAAITSDNLLILKKLYAKEPKLMASAMKDRIKFVGYNPLMLAIAYECSQDMIDFILANGVSPVETDNENGFNIYHLMARGSNSKIVEHLLRKLPRDINEVLLAQQTKHKLRTPFHQAVINGHKSMVAQIVKFAQSNPELLKYLMMTRDVTADLPLHTAIMRGYSVIVQELVKNSPVEALHAENGVGNTPLEIATLKETLNRIRSSDGIHASGCNYHYVDLDPMPDRMRVEHLEKNVPELRQTIAALTRDGKLTDTRVAEELAKFTQHMETKLTAAKAEAEKLEEEEKSNLEKSGTGTPVVEKAESDNSESNPEATFKAILEAVTAKPAKRGLVHVADVQRSVGGHLKDAKFNNNDNNMTWRERRRKNELEPEEGEEEKLKQTNAIYLRLNAWYNESDDLDSESD